MKFNKEIEAENFNDELKTKLMSRVENINELSKFKAILVIFKKEHNFKACGKFTKQYWVQRGWSEDDAIILKEKFKRKLPPGPMQVEFWTKKINPNTCLKYTEDEAKYKIKSQRPINKEYWIAKGYSTDDAIKKVVDVQQKNGRKWQEKNKVDPKLDRTHSQLLYWVNKHDMSIAEAKIKLKDVQNTIGLDARINKYGEIEGKVQYDKTCGKLSFAGTMAGYIKRYGPELGPELHKEKTIKCCTNNRVSKESIQFFLPIYKFFRNSGIKRNEIYWGISGSSEYFLHEKYNNKIFWYDFTIPKLKLIIEFHGTRYHPNPNWDKHKWNKWELFGHNANEKREFDIFKKTLAEKNGYTLIEIWSDEKYNFDKNILSKFINC